MAKLETIFCILQRHSDMPFSFYKFLQTPNHSGPSTVERIPAPPLQVVQGVSAGDRHSIPETPMIDDPLPKRKTVLDVFMRHKGVPFSFHKFLKKPKGQAPFVFVWFPAPAVEPLKCCPLLRVQFFFPSALSLNPIAELDPVFQVFRRNSYMAFPLDEVLQKFEFLSPFTLIPVSRVLGASCGYFLIFLSQLSQAFAPLIFHFTPHSIFLKKTHRFIPSIEGEISEHKLVICDSQAEAEYWKPHISSIQCAENAELILQLSPKLRINLDVNRFSTGPSVFPRTVITRGI